MRWPLVVVTIAITALLASAATVGAERLITGADIKDGSITARDIRPGSLSSDRLERAARHTIYVSKPKRTRQSSVTITANWTTVVSVTVPPGTYALQAMTTIQNTSQSQSDVQCQLADNRNVLSGQFQQWIAMPGSAPGGQGVLSTPTTVIGVATYSSQATVSLQCWQSQSVVAYAVGGAITAEQVTSIVGG